MKSTQRIFVFALLAAFAAACKDDNVKLTVEQYLTAPENGWVFESVIVTNPINGQEVDLTKDPDSFEACDLDNAVIFTSDNKYTVKSNTKCETTDPDTDDAGTWSLNTDKTQLSVISTSGGPDLTLTKLVVDDTNIKGEASSYDGFPIVAKITMKKK